MLEIPEYLIETAGRFDLLSASEHTENGEESQGAIEA